MFLVFNKEKIQTYIVSVLTVAVLITIANVRKVETIQTSSQEKELPIYNVQTDEKKVAFTMNCAWNADDIDKILETLQKNNVKITEARYFKLSNMKKYGYFEEIKNKSVLTYDGVACTWSAIGTINFYTGRDFADNYLEAYPNKELFYAYAAKRNLGYEGNFVIMDDILYFLAYI